MALQMADTLVHTPRTVDCTMTERLSAERLAEIRELYAFDDRHVVNEIFAELDAVTREREEAYKRLLRYGYDEDVAELKAGKP